MSDNDYRSTNINNAGEYDDCVGFTFYVFDVQYQKELESAQPIKVEFKVSEKIPAGIYGFSPVLTNKLVSTSSNGQRHFDLFRFEVSITLSFSFIHKFVCFSNTSAYLSGS